MGSVKGGDTMLPRQFAINDDFPLHLGEPKRIIPKPKPEPEKPKHDWNQATLGDVVAQLTGGSPAPMELCIADEFFIGDVCITQGDELVIVFDDLVAPPLKYLLLPGPGFEAGETEFFCGD
jgi:hypothetical protein